MPRDGLSADELASTAGERVVLEAFLDGYRDEVGWFHQVLGSGTGDNRRTHSRESEFQLEPEETVQSLIEAYRQACATSRSLAADRSLDQTVPHDRMGKVSARWIYVHLIEETARHAGHMDILREQIDGVAG